MSNLLQPFRTAGLIKGAKINARRIASLPLAQLLDLVDNVCAKTADNAALREENSASHHTASVPMAGGPGGCSELTCRLQRVDELARFAALYSDRVYFHNFLAGIAPAFGHPPEKDSAEFRMDVAEHLLLLLYMEPLIRAEVLVPFSTPRTYCPVCFARLSVDRQVGDRVQLALKDLSDALLDSMSVDVEKRAGIYGCISSTDLLDEHDATVMIHDEAPSALRARPRILRQVESGRRIRASQALKRELGVHEAAASAILYSVVYQMSIADRSNASVLTARQIEVDALRAITDDPHLNGWNETIGDYLSPIVPIAGDVPLGKLLRLRERNPEALIRFRAALRRAADAARGEQSRLSAGRARQLYNEVLAPEVARLEQMVREAKRDLIEAPLISSVGVGAIVLGAYIGMLPSEAAVVAKALGLPKVAYDAVTKILHLSDTKSGARQEKFYYLWKIHRSAKKGSRRKLRKRRRKEAT